MQFVNFCSDLMYVLPGQNNQVYGEKVFKQNHYLMWTIRELTSLMQDSSDDSINNIKFSTLYRFIKLNKQFNFSSIQMPPFVKCCNLQSKKKICAQELCSECPDVNFVDIHCIDNIPYYAWKKISGRCYPEKVLVDISGSEAYDKNKKLH
ncbi:unnamed protein product [Clavelina lepadiformis]|uniref:Uncharacterized protein n=1 Tax=Clavelina lepadiformis TaxID=159417 RepID=A0ABP0FU85_CLALP